jgi:hypothetical protein
MVAGSPRGQALLQLVLPGPAAPCRCGEQLQRPGPRSVQQLASCRPSRRNSLIKIGIPANVPVGCQLGGRRVDTRHSGPDCVPG